MKIKPVAWAVTSGIVWGAIMLLATWWMVIGGMPGRNLVRLKVFYLGYSVSFLGGLVGLFWGFVYAFVIGFFFAQIYNTLAKEKPS